MAVLSSTPSKASTSCLSFVDKSLRPGYDDSVTETYDICVLSVGSAFRYVIPSFCSFAVEMRQMRMTAEHITGKQVTYDIFIRNDLSLHRCYPTLLRITDFIQIHLKEFNECVNTDGMQLMTPSEVVVVMNWEWLDEDEESELSTNRTHVSESSLEDTHYNPCLKSDDDDETDAEIPIPCMTFKCIGAVRDPSSQDSLEKARDMLKDGKCVEVRINPEPNNQYDSKAIAFQCVIENKCSRIGYIVREALDDVHRAITTNSIISVKFSWIKYLVTWITTKGKWSPVVHGCASTHV